MAALNEAVPLPPWMRLPMTEPEVQRPLPRRPSAPQGPPPIGATELLGGQLEGLLAVLTEELPP